MAMCNEYPIPRYCKCEGITIHLGKICTAAPFKSFGKRSRYTAPCQEAVVFLLHLNSNCCAEKRYNMDEFVRGQIVREHVSRRV